MNVVIRKKNKEDCIDVQKIITKSWQDTYKGIVNDDFLNLLSENEEERIIASQNSFDENNNQELVLEIDKEIVGFVKYGESNDHNYKGYGEINAIYILNQFKGFGYGKLLIKEVVKKLILNGFDKMIIGCLNGNPSNGFYKHLGGKLDTTRTITRGNQDLVENVYVFEGIKQIDLTGKQYWKAIELMPLLEYSKWENFNKVIKRGMIAWETSKKMLMTNFLNSGNWLIQVQKQKEKLLIIIYQDMPVI